MNRNLIYGSVWVLLLSLILVEARASTEDVLKLEIAVLPEAGRYVDLLAYPSYLAVALENNGIKVSNSGGITVLDGRKLQFKNATVSFVQRKGTVFYYEANVDWDIGITQAGFKLPIEVDIGALEKGKVVVTVHLPLANLVPSALVDKIRFKAANLANISLQKIMLTYLDNLDAKAPEGIKMERIIELVMIQAYNRAANAARTATGREPGDAEPITDQILFLLTLFIWLVILPMAITGRFLWRRYKKRRAVG